MVARGLAALLSLALALGAPAPIWAGLGVVAQSGGAAAGTAVVPVVPQGVIASSLVSPASTLSAQAPTLVAPVGPVFLQPVLPVSADRPQAATAFAGAAAAAPAPAVKAAAAPYAAHVADRALSRGSAAPEAVEAAAVPALGEGVILGREASEEQAPDARAAEDKRGEMSAGANRARAELKNFPSPERWEDEVLQFVVTDRYQPGPSALKRGDPADGRSRHGGDLKGLISRLDYLKGMGVTTIIPTPFVRNTPEGYHGYHPVELREVDSHLGSLEDVKTLVREAHGRGMRVVMDAVLNHMGLVFDYEGSDQWEGRERMPKPISRWRHRPAGLDENDFNRGGILNNWGDHDQERYADFFFDLRQLNTSRPETQDKLIQTLLWWITETGIDGIRLDAFKHFDEGFRSRLVAAVRSHAAGLGKDNFMILGEIMTRSDGDIAPYLGSQGLSAAYDYPGYFRNLLSLYGLAPTRWVEESLNISRQMFGRFATWLTPFLSTHDVPRFLKEKEHRGWLEDSLRLMQEAFGPVGGDFLRALSVKDLQAVIDKLDLQAVLHVALAFLLTGSLGPPLTYYGEEQALAQPVGKPLEPGNREDMFAGGAYKSKSSEGDKFDTGSPTYRHFKSLTALREAYPALRRGELWVRWSDPWGPGILAYSRVYKGQEVVVVLNTAGEARSAEMFVDVDLSPAGVRLVDALDPGYELETTAPEGGGSRISVNVPAHGARVLVRPAARQP